MDNSSKQFWLSKLSGIEQCRLQADCLSKNPVTYKKEIVCFDKAISQKIDEISMKNDLSNFVLFLTFLKIILFKITGQQDISIVSPVYKKESTKFNKYIILRDIINREWTFKELLYQIAGTVKEAIQNEDYPLDDLINSRTNANNENLHKIIFSQPGDTSLPNYSELFNVELHFKYILQNDLYGIEVEYNEKLYQQKTILQLLHFFLRVAPQILNWKDIKISNVLLISKEEKSKILHQQKINDVDLSLPIIDQFEKIVRKFPDKKAVYSIQDSINIYDNLRNEQQLISISYKELDVKSNELAYLLLEKNITSNSIVGLFLEHPIDICIAMLGILKSRGAYLCLNPSNPQKYNLNIIDDCNPSLIISKQNLWSSLSPSTHIEFIDFDIVNSTPHKVWNQLPRYDGSQTAYVLYTSGTSGNAKGVIVSQKSLANYVNWKINEFKYSCNDINLQPLAYNFDGFASNFYPSLLMGGTLCYIPDNKRNEPKVYQYFFEKLKITSFNAVPEILKLIINNLQEEHLAFLRFIVVAGEKTQPELIEAVKNKMPKVLLSNEYGPTEATVGCSIKHNLSADQPSFIGKPINNTSILILDEIQELVPEGFPGEICISGICLSDGYINNPELTASSFLFNNLLKKRLYRTGDIGRWIDGDLEIIGRGDQQIKIRGHLVNLKTIETIINKHEDIVDAKIIIDESTSNEKTIFAFYVPKVINKKLDLRSDFLKELPEYMIPNRFIPLIEFPLMQNGKVNLTELKSLTIQKSTEQKKMSLTEKRINRIWAEILEINENEINVDSNFFELGGHSIKATLLSASIEKEFNVNISVIDVFENNTISTLANFIFNSKYSHKVFKKAEKKEYYNVSSAQKRIFVMHNSFSSNTAYNLPQVLEVEGNLSDDFFEACLNKIIDRHESLRTSFIYINNMLIQKINPIKLKVERAKIKFEKLDQYIQDFIQPFDLSQPPLIRASIVQTEGKKIILLDIHHIIIDWVSISIIKQELVTLFSHNQLEESIDVPQYKDFSEWQNHILKSAAIKDSEKYWIEIFNDYSEKLKLPADFDSSHEGYQGETVKFEIDNETYKKIKDIAREFEMTVFMVLLCFYKILLSKISRCEKVIVGTESFGRNIIEIENVVGLFINTLPIKSSPLPEKKCSDFLIEVKQSVLNALLHEDFQYDLLIENLNRKNNNFESSFINTFFSYQKDDTTSNYSLNQNGSEVKLLPYFYKNETSKFDLTLNVVEKDQLMMSFEYNSSLFKPSTISKIINYFKYILGNSTNSIECKINDIQLIPALDNLSYDAIENYLKPNSAIQSSNIESDFIF